MEKHPGKQLERMQEWKKTLLNTVQKYDDLVGARHIPLMRFFMNDVRTILEGELPFNDDDGPSFSKKYKTVSSQECDDLNPAVEISQAASKALAVEIVLKNIFQHVTVQDLKNFRLVNRKWKNEASRELCSRESVHVRLRYNEVQEEFFVGPGDSNYFLKDLAEVISDSEYSPSTSIFIDAILNASNLPALRNFFVQQGSHLKTIHLGRVDAAVVLSEILKQTVNIDYLRINALFIGNDLHENDMESFFDEFRLDQEGHRGVEFKQPLKSLRKLRIDSVFRPKISRTELYDKLQNNNELVFRALLEASQSLRSIEVKNLEKNLLAQIVNQQKGFLFKYMHFAPTVENIDLFEQLAAQEPQLHKLRFCNVDCIFKFPLHARTGACLTKLLISSQHSLKELSLQPTAFLKNFEMQQLTQLERITFKCLSRPEHVPNITMYARMFFRGGFVFTSSTFPRLKSIRFCLKMRGQCTAEYFPWDNPDSEVLETIPTVEKVEVIGDLDVYGLRFIKTKFPNITALKLNHTNYPCRRDLHSIWTFLPEKLQYLELSEDSLDLESDEGNNQTLDSIFTGFSENICGVLRRHFMSQTQGNLPKRQRSTICDLRSLKTLKFTFINRESYTNRVWFSAVSGKFAFALMPQLEVIITYDRLAGNARALENGLQLIAPYVRFEHKETAWGMIERNTVPSQYNS